MSHYLDELLTLMAQLRDPKHGCAWDVKQTFASIAPHTLEEACEVVEAIEREDFDNLKEELGDLLLHVIFHTQMAREAGYFDFADVSQTLQAKLIRRHPHVFPDGSVKSFGSAKKLTPEEVEQKWQAIKAEEKPQQRSSIMPSDLPRTLPTLQRAEKIQSAAATVGFDWIRVEPVFDKIHEELDEIRAAKGQERIAEEVGDLLFACVNLARHLDVNAEMALRQACGKFSGRFEKMEQLAKANQQSIEQLTLDEMERYWQQSKQFEQ